MKHEYIDYIIAGGAILYVAFWVWIFIEVRNAPIEEEKIDGFYEHFKSKMESHPDDGNNETTPTNKQ